MIEMPMTRPLDRLLAIMAQLRDPEHGCPWDRAQDFATIAPYKIEEAYEVADAIARGDPAALKDELGDLLFQSVFHARMAEEAGLFDLNDLARASSDKMLRRHPHVFGNAMIADATAQTLAGEAHKAAERPASAAATGEPQSALAGVGEALPALTRAVKLQGRAARVGFEWRELRPILDKISEEIDELRAELDAAGAPARIADEVGDLLFAVANLARRAEADPEQALRAACRKFERRFHRVEALLAAAGSSADAAGLEEMETLWRQVKKDHG